MKGRRWGVDWELVTASVLIGQENLAAAVPALADEGAEALEVWMNSAAHFDATSATDVEDLRSALDAHGLRAHSAHAPFGEQLDISALDQTARLDAVATVGVTIHAGADLGARIVVIHPGVGTVESDERPARVRAATESLAALAGVAERCGVRIAVENMTPGTVGGCAEELAHIVDAVSAPDVGVCLDTGHAHIGEGVTQAISVLGGRIIAMHLDDNDGQTDQHILPSKGTIDWAATVAALREANYEAPICLETGRWEDLTIREMQEIVHGVLA